MPRLLGLHDDTTYIRATSSVTVSGKCLANVTTPTSNRCSQAQSTVLEAHAQPTPSMASIDLQPTCLIRKMHGYRLLLCAAHTVNSEVC